MFHLDSQMILGLIFVTLIAAFSAYYANRQGRNPALWFILGILIGLIAPLILIFFPPKKEEDASAPNMSIEAPDPSLEKIASFPVPKSNEEIQIEEKLWFYLDNQKQQIGPVSTLALRELWNRGTLELNSYVWSNGMKDWEKVDQLPELKAVLSKI